MVAFSINATDGLIQREREREGERERKREREREKERVRHGLAKILKRQLSLKFTM